MNKKNYISDGVGKGEESITKYLIFTRSEGFAESPGVNYLSGRGENCEILSLLYPYIFFPSLSLTFFLFHPLRGVG